MRSSAIAIAGAGLSGAVIARLLADAGHDVQVFESRDHLAGNCYTYRDPSSGVLVHKYGPHIFHTDDAEVWDFVKGFVEFAPYTNRVKAITGGHVYSLPINLHTINQFFGRLMGPAEAARFLESKADLSISAPASFEEQALRFVGRDLYEAFFKGYTQKQWGVHPSELPAEILKRLPVRFNYDDNYFNHRFQGMPIEGYTALVERLLQNARIEVHLSEPFDRRQTREFRHTFYSGPIDGYFDFSMGVLGYRTLEFEAFRAEGDFQGNAVINYCDADVPWTRISEHKHFAPWESHTATICFREFSREFQVGDVPFYPIRLVTERALLGQYIARAQQEPRVSFVGRLGTYRYLDMDVTIREALDAGRTYLRCLDRGTDAPTFYVNPG